jgi:hypothetical protein
MAGCYYFSEIVTETGVIILIVCFTRRFTNKKIMQNPAIIENTAREKSFLKTIMVVPKKTINKPTIPKTKATSILLLLKG